MSVGTMRWLDEHGADLAALLAIDGNKTDLLELAEQLGQIGHWRVSLSDKSLTWSAAIYRIHGVTPDGYTPDIQSALSFYHPDDRDAVTNTLTRAAREGMPFEFSLRLIRADGELRHVKSRGLTIPGSDGVPSAIFGVFLDVTEQHEANLKLERMAYVDALTRLGNRRQFDESLEREWGRAIREQTALSLIILDIDRFKRFNDLYGHPAGDECLRAVAGVMASVVHRSGDLAARYGGEEFVLILPVTEATAAEKVANALRAAIATLKLPHAGNASCGGFVTASLGVSTAYPQAGGPQTKWLDLIAEADALLYEAKRTGRNRVASPANIGHRGTPPLLENEAHRLAALAMYERAGATKRTAELSRIAQLAAKLMSSPIGLVSLVGRDEQRFAGSFGLQDVDGTGRDISFCAHTILQDDPFVVPDATRDIRFDENALVTGDFGLRYYAGAPIICETTGHRLGTVCVVDKTARAETSPAQRTLLTELAKMTAAILKEQLNSNSQHEVVESLNW